jgi:hypothetical protein
VATDRAEVRAKASGDVDCAAPGFGNTVNVGGDAEFLLKGETVVNRFNQLATTLSGLAPAGNPVDAVALVNAILLALQGFSALAFVFLASKGKVT